jgi:hypothetical protein
MYTIHGKMIKGMDTTIRIMRLSHDFVFFARIFSHIVLISNKLRMRGKMF